MQGFKPLHTFQIIRHHLVAGFHPTFSRLNIVDAKHRFCIRLTENVTYFRHNIRFLSTSLMSINPKPRPQ